MLTASLAVALAAPPAFADPLGEILSMARRIAYGNGYAVKTRPAVPYAVSYNYWQGGFQDGQPGGRSFYYEGSSDIDALSQVDYRTLRGVVRAAAAEFDRWLSGIPAGEVWRKHFDTRALQQLAASDVDAPPSADEREVIVRILGTFDDSVENPDLRQLTGRDSARALHIALRELTTPNDQRQIRQLSFSARSLNRSLAAFSTGVTWQRYLALPDGILAAADRPPGEAAPRQEFDAEELTQILERYDRVNGSQEYRAIAALPEFQATHQRLAAFVNPPAEQPPPLPSAVAEELPPPELRTK
jgi:hypothetical protein